VGYVKVVDINFARAKIFVLDTSDSSKVRARSYNGQYPIDQDQVVKEGETIQGIA